MTETKALKKINAKLTPTLFPGCESYGNADYDNDGYWECFFRHMTQTMWSVYETGIFFSELREQKKIVSGITHQRLKWEVDRMTKRLWLIRI